MSVLAFPDAAPYRLADVASFLLVRADEPGPLAARPFTGEVTEPPRMAVRAGAPGRDTCRRPSSTRARHCEPSENGSDCAWRKKLRVTRKHALPNGGDALQKWHI